MKRPIILFLISAMLFLFNACMDRPDGLENKEPETKAETEYAPPPKDYLEQLALDPGYADFPDSLWCYQAPVMSDNDFVTAEEIVFNPDKPTDGRFISYNYMLTTELTISGELPVYADYSTLITEYPNVSYLTYPDGTREKLCPYEECRNDPYEPCTHVNLAHGLILGDWVYFTGANYCLAAPGNPRRSDENGCVNMLLRYSLTEHRIEKYLDLSGPVYQYFTAYGVLYLECRDPVSAMDYFILIDENGQIAKAPSVTRCTIPLSSYLYGTYGDQVIRTAYNLTEPEEFTLNNSGHPSIRGTAKEKLYLILQVSRGGSDSEESSEPHRTLITLDTNGNETVLLDGVYDIVVNEDALFVLRHEPSVAFTVTDRMGDERKYYTNSDGKVYRYTLASDGTINGTGEVVFDAASDASSDGEFLYGIEPYGSSIRIQTFFAPPLDNNNLPGTRFYLITDEGIREDGESLFHNYR